MALKPDAALRKDRLGANYPAKLEHRHFAVIAGILKDLGPNQGVFPNQNQAICEYFADELAGTNANFDRARFLTACGIGQ